jgi:hypothetical protein
LPEMTALPRSIGLSIAFKVSVRFMIMFDKTSSN